MSHDTHTFLFDWLCWASVLLILDHGWAVSIRSGSD